MLSAIDGGRQCAGVHPAGVISGFYRMRIELWRSVKFFCMLHNLQMLDEELFLFLNRIHNAFFDVIMYWASDQFIWIPLYVWLFFFFYRQFRMTALYYLFWIVLLEVVSDQLSSHIIKNWVCRPRPSHVVSLIPYIHLSEAGPGGLYGFVSGHACNSWALAVFVCVLLSPGYRRLTQALLVWAGLISYSRIYNGVHYPGDVLVGALLGAFLGYGFARLFRYFFGAWLLFVAKLAERRRQ